MLEKALGPQRVTVTGVPDDSHFARVMIASDIHMKWIGMNLEPSPVASLPGYLDLIRSRGELPATTTPRWWMECSYEPLIRSDDGLAWELRGPGVKVKTADTLIRADGTIQRSDQVAPAAQEWADLMTASYEALSKEDAVFGQLRNLMDLCVVAALVEREDLLSKAACDLAVLTDPESDLATGIWNPARIVPTQCSFTRIGRQFVVTASGGVKIQSWQVIDSVQRDPRINRTRQQAAPGNAARLWWN
jgi:hypothetical protein